VDDKPEIKGRWWLIFPTALLVMVVNVLLHVSYMVVYGYVINPGEPAEFYQEYAQASAPYSSIIAGMPLMFLAGLWIGRKFPRRNSVKAAVLVWLVYFLIDGAILALTGTLVAVAALFAASFATKFASASLGGFLAQKRGINKG